MPNLRSVVIPAALLAVGIAAGYGVRSLLAHPTLLNAELIGTALRDEHKNYSFIKPLLACNIDATETTAEYQPLKEHLQKTIDTLTRESTVESVSVYFRDLDAGLWTTLGGSEQYAPGSLMKVPILIAYLKQSERDALLLEHVIDIVNDPITGEAQNVPPSETVQAGRSYTIGELLELMIRYSDNRAMAVLMQHVDGDVLRDILEDLGIPTPQKGTTYDITPRMYSRLFRILYNGTYLLRSTSEQALSMLAKAEYPDGLLAGVPVGTTVAHKFGESSATLEDGSVGHELHDCGIIYADQPYLLCVMTRGEQEADLTAAIAAISREVYEEMQE